MLNRIFKTKFDPASGLSYAVSEFGKSHNSKAVSLSALAILVSAISFTPSSQAACPTPNIGQGVTQVGEVCSYDGTGYSDSSTTSAVVDIKEGGSATFSAGNISLKKTGGTPAGTYAAIFLRQDGNLTNKAVFEGNVNVESSPAINTRNIILGGGSHLHIKGDLALNRTNRTSTAGAIFALNHDAWGNERTDTKMIIDGNATINLERSSLIRMGTGEYLFAKDLIVNAKHNGSINTYDKTAAKFTVLGNTIVTNDETFLDIREGAAAEINFNKITITNDGNQDVFALRSGITTINGDSQFNTPNADAIKLYGKATFNNGGNLTATTKDGIKIKAIPTIGATAIFNNLENGVITNDKHIAVNDGAGTLEINNAGKLTSTTDEIFKNTTDGIISATNTGILEGFLTSSDNDSLSLTNDTTGVWNNNKDSSLDTLVNKGTINFIAPADKSHLTISTDKYTGGGTLVMNTIWTDSDTSTSDKLKIKTIEGDAVTTVKLVGEKFDAITALPKVQSTVNVIEVENDHSGNLFVGTAKTNSPQEAQLARVGNNYVWTVEAIIEEPEPQPQPPVNNPPADPNNPQPEKPKPKTVPIISQPVVGYVQQPFINRQMGFAQMGKLHERVGEQRHLAWKNGVAANQLWGRISHDYTMLQGKERFGANVKSGFVQFGRDIQFKLNQDNSQQHTGLTFTYGWATSKFFDKYRAKNGIVVADKYTGGAKSDMFSLGGYHTYYSPTGAYVDVVGQVSWLQNRYNSDNTQVKQKGYGLGASIEVGKPFPLLNPQVTVEPQAQLSYQSIWLNGFNDGVREVKKSRQDSLIGRVGVRVNWSETLEHNSPQVYFTVNLMQTLTGKSSQIVVGSQKVEERFGDLAAEFGVGGQYPIKPNLSLYADFRHVIGLKDQHRVHRSSDLSLKSYNGRIGIRYSW